ncbi:MAG TPA: RidA family protein [Nitrososphaeraceae archaeon]|nr:RidA family protein [Nitrososphaeraceae archaeon]
MINKETTSFGMSWEEEYGYSQAIKVGDTIYISGQVSHDDKGKIVGSDMESQMRQSYINVKKVLASYGASMENIVDETLFVTDMETAFAAAIKCRHEVFSGKPIVASTIIQIQRLAYPGLLIEIKCIAKL